ncbi:MAG: SurA N-terminal domain-containing protein [Treponema sp.]|jgi:hypothetical protein|nr:SurA N-terminal domain-containing protein [Treponema sp.]
MAKKEKKAQAQDSESSSSEMLRRFKANPGVFIGTFIVLILVVISFVLVPALVPESSRRGGDLIFGYYDKAPISWVPGNYFSRYQEQLIRYYQGWIEINDFQSARDFIWRPAFEAALVHTAILQEVKRAKYTVPAKTVDRQVAQLPQFQENGRFSSALYKRMSDTSRLQLWRQIQDELAKELYYSSVISLMQPSAEADFIAKMASNMRKFEMASFQLDDYPASEYMAYAQENPDLFKSIHLSRISVNSGEREARQILNSIKDGTTTFEDAARSQSQDPYSERGGDMGIRYLYELEWEITEPAAREKIISFGRGEMSDVMQIGSMWAFFRVEDELKAANLEDATVIERIRFYMKSNVKGRMEDWAIAAAMDFIADVKSSNFDAALDKIKKTKSSFGPIPVNYGDVDLFSTLASFSIPELANSSTNDYFWKIAFSTQLNTPSEPFVQGDNVLVFLPVEVTETEEVDIEGIASVYSSYWANSIAERSLQTYFLGSEKTEDRFYQTYDRYFKPSNF